VGYLGVGAAESVAVLGPLHEQQSRQYFEEERLDPGRHVVRRRRPELDVDDEDRQHDGTRDQNHREEDVLADEGSGERRGRVDLDHQKQEDVERVEDRDGHRDLFSGLGRHVEDQQRDLEI